MLYADLSPWMAIPSCPAIRGHRPYSHWLVAQREQSVISWDLQSLFGPYYSINRLGPQWCLAAWLFAFAGILKVGYNTVRFAGTEGPRLWETA